MGTFKIDCWPAPPEFQQASFVCVQTEVIMLPLCNYGKTRDTYPQPNRAWKSLENL